MLDIGVNSVKNHREVKNILGVKFVIDNDQYGTEI